MVIGSINADVVTQVGHHPRPGETVMGTDVCRYPGGKGANQAVAAARLGADTCFVGRIGGDAESGMLASALTGAGVDTTALRTDETAPSGVALIVVDGAGENTIVVSPGANHRVTHADVESAFDTLGAVAVVVLQCELPAETVAYAARAAARRGARTILNLAPPMALGAEVLALADPLVVNAHEAAFVLGWAASADGPARESANPGTTGDTEEAGARTASRLCEFGPSSAVVTLGGAGAASSDGVNTAFSAAPSVPVVDTTGAGDAFTGALATRLAAGADVHTATRFAVGVGAAAVRGSGAQSSFPTWREVAET